jgi:hypothetical protein
MLGAFALVFSFFRTEEAPVLLLLAAATVAAIVALVLRILERPRPFIQYRASRTQGLPIVHLAGARSRSDS